MSPRAALTGATGFLGIHLLPALLRAGFEVRILARREPAHPAWAGLRFEAIRGDLADEHAVAALLQGADVVVHAAGLIKAASRAAFLRVNRGGTAFLAEAARRLAPDASFLLVSSLAAREPLLSPYAFSKAAAEQAARLAYTDAPEQLAILRPPAIYGPWDRETLTIFRAVRRPVAPVPGQGRAAMLHAADAANAIAGLAARFRPGRFALADTRPEGYPRLELLQEAARAVGRQPRFVAVPDGVLLAAAAAAGLCSRLAGRPGLFGLGKARELLHPDWSVSAAELLPADIFAPRYGLAEGFAETAAWYRAQGWL